MSAIVTKNSRRCSVEGLRVSSRSTARFLSQFLKIAKPSSDEIDFLESAIVFGIDAAVEIAAKFHWDCQRPLKVLTAPSLLACSGLTGSSSRISISGRRVTPSPSSTARQAARQTTQG
jgi:hypothetical protein